MSDYPSAASSLRRSSTSATTTERPSVDRANLSPRDIRRMIDLSSGLGMGGNVRPLAACSNAIRANSAAFQPVSEEQASAIRQMRAAVSSAVTPARVKAALRWEYTRARRWVVFAKAKRLLTEAGEWT